MKTDVRVIAFDYGNVIVVNTVKLLEDFLGLDKLSEAKQHYYQKANDDAETGKGTTQNYLKAIKGIWQLPYSTKQIEQLLTDSSLIEPIWNLAQKLRKNYKVVIISNIQKTWPEKYAKSVGINLKGIKFYNSSKIGAIKPDAKFYKFVLRDLKIKPAEMVFIDDAKENIAGAKKLGIKTIHFTGDVKAVYTALKKYGVKI